MKLKLSTLLLAFLLALFTPSMMGQDGGLNVDKQLTEREGKINQLTLDEQLLLRATQQKAIEDPAVKEALAKRDAAIEGFRQAMHDAMVKANPKVEAVLLKISVGSSPGF